jgi:hypothetical protein
MVETVALAHMSQDIWFVVSSYPSGKSPVFNGSIHYKWQFSMAMLNNQRVSENGVPLIPTAWWWTNPPEKYMSESQLG